MFLTYETNHFYEININRLLWRLFIYFNYFPSLCSPPGFKVWMSWIRFFKLFIRSVSLQFFIFVTIFRINFPCFFSLLFYQRNKWILYSKFVCIQLMIVIEMQINKMWCLMLLFLFYNWQRILPTATSHCTQAINRFGINQQLAIKTTYIAISVKSIV